MTDPGFNPSALITAAERESGLSDWGDPSFRPALDALCASLEHEADLNAKGRARLSHRVLGDLVQRLKLIDDHKTIPGLAGVEIRAPIIVTGNGRSGTTLMHKLLSADPAHRPVLTWEMRRPSPPPLAETWDNDPRIEEIEREMEADGYKTPDAMARHHFGADQADECSILLGLACVGGIYGAMARTPGYTAYREAVDFTAPYALHKQVLQNLAFRGPGGRMVIKAPEHMFHLPELLAAYPDAIVVQMHRDPARVVPSLISVVAKMQSFYTDTVDVAAIRDMRMGYARIMNALPGIRAALDRPGRFFDVHFLDLARDPAGTVRGFYEQAGLEFTAGAGAAIDAHMASNPRGRFGAHAYRLEDYGLTLEAIDAAFAPYIAANHVRLER